MNLFAKQQKPQRILALGAPSAGFERYLDFLQFLKIIGEDNSNLRIDIINAKFDMKTVNEGRKIQLKDVENDGLELVSESLDDAFINEIHNKIGEENLNFINSPE